MNMNNGYRNCCVGMAAKKTRLHRPLSYMTE